MNAIEREGRIDTAVETRGATAVNRSVDGQNRVQWRSRRSAAGKRTNAHSLFTSIRITRIANIRHPNGAVSPSVVFN